MKRVLFAAVLVVLFQAIPFVSSQGSENTFLWFTPINASNTLRDSFSDYAQIDPSPLTDGITSICALGVPGPLFSVRPGVVPIVVGDEDTIPFPSAVVMTAGIGKGRVVALGHEGFLTNEALKLFDNKRFGNNIIDWLDKSNTRKILVTIGHQEWYGGSNFDDFKNELENRGYKVTRYAGSLTESILSGVGVVIVGNIWGIISQSEIDALKNFAVNGGGLLLMGLGWSWEPYHPGLTLDDYPMNKIGKIFGIRWIDGYISDPTHNYNGQPIFHTFYPNIAPSFHAISFDVSPRVSGFMLNNTRYAIDQIPIVFWLPNGATYSFEVSTMFQIEPGIRYVFEGWADGVKSTKRMLTISSSATFVAQYRTEYLVSISSYYGTVLGGGWYKAGDEARIEVSNIVDHANGTRRVFTSWTGDINTTTTRLILKVNSPITLKANWRTEYYLKIESEYGIPHGEGWYYAGTMARFEVDSIVDHGNGTRRLFTSWSGDLTISDAVGTVLMDSPKKIIANWKTQYYLTVKSEYGSPKGEGWYDAGSTATFSVTSPIGFLIQQVFIGWSGDLVATMPVATIMMDSPKTVIASWRTDYTQLYLTIIGVVAIGVISLVSIKRQRKKS